MPKPRRPRLFGDYQQRPAEVWQLALDRAPLPVLDDDDQPFLPEVAVCLNVARDLIEMSAPTKASSDQGAANAREALRRGAREWRVKPGRVLTEDAGLAGALRAELAEEGVAIEARPQLAEIRGVLSTLQATLAEPDMVPDLLAGEGVTLEQVGAFANAAQQFFEHAPWRWLSDEDLLRVESPDLGAELQHFVIMGAAGEQFGLLFFDSPETWEKVFDLDPEERLDDQAYWAVTIDEPAEALPTDVALWLRHDPELPKSGGTRIPVALYFHKAAPKRPDARTLAFFEGILSAFAGITEEAIDRGRFESAVLTHKGPATFVFSLPGLLEDQEIYDRLGEVDGDAASREEDGPDPESLEPEEGEDGEAEVRGIGRRLRKLLAQHDFASLEEAREHLRHGVAAGEIEPSDFSPEERRAYELLEIATEVRGRRRIQLARKALAIDPGLADAYSFLGRQSGDLEEALSLYEKALKAARERIDPELFTEGVGNFWIYNETRPYLRARLGLAETLRDLGRLEESIEHLEEVLRLDGPDYPGNRHAAADLYFELDRMEPLGDLLERFAGDRSAAWSFTRALYQFRLDGDSPAALRALRRACQTNPYVPVYLLGEKEIPEEIPELFEPGGEDEAADYASSAFDAWDETPEALDWLAACAPPPPRPEARRHRGKKGKGGKHPHRKEGSKRRE